MSSPSSSSLRVVVGCVEIDDGRDSFGGDDLNGGWGREGGFEFLLNSGEGGDDGWTEVESEGSG